VAESPAAGDAADPVPTDQSGPPLRVLHLTSVETANYFLSNLVDFTDRQVVGYSAVTFGRPGSFVSDFHRRGLAADAMGCTTPTSFLLAVPRLIRIVRERSIDILHGHLFWPSVATVLLARRLGRAAVVTRHHSDAIHRLKGAVRRSLYLQVDRWTNRLADHIIAPAKAVRDVLVDKEDVPAGKVSVIPYGQRAERFDVIAGDLERARAELGGGTLNIVCVSRLHQEKGHVYLFRAFAALRSEGVDAVLHLVGVGPDEARLRAEAGRLAIADRVRFLGWRDDVLALMAAAEVIVHPSLHEALPSAVIEAVMLEKPIVATDVSGVRDVLGDDAFGTVVRPADSDALHQALSRTIGSLEEAQRKAAGGRQAVLTYMGAARVARAHVGCYRAVLSRTATQRRRR
jgi:glycosyltransferase involved in cell wall biosynthesis